jgi:hypothetical protein
VASAEDLLAMPLSGKGLLAKPFLAKERGKSEIIFS